MNYPWANNGSFFFVKNELVKQSNFFRKKQILAFYIFYGQTTNKYLIDKKLKSIFLIIFRLRFDNFGGLLRETEFLSIELCVSDRQFLRWDRKCNLWRWPIVFSPWLSCEDIPKVSWDVWWWLLHKRIFYYLR